MQWSERPKTLGSLGSSLDVFFSKHDSKRFEEGFKPSWQNTCLVFIKKKVTNNSKLFVEDHLVRPRKKNITINKPSNKLVVFFLPQNAEA